MAKIERALDSSKLIELVMVFSEDNGFLASIRQGCVTKHLTEVPAFHEYSEDGWDSSWERNFEIVLKRKNKPPKVSYELVQNDNYKENGTERHDSHSCVITRHSHGIVVSAKYHHGYIDKKSGKDTLSHSAETFVDLRYDLGKLVLAQLKELNDDC